MQNYQCWAEGEADNSYRDIDNLTAQIFLHAQKRNKL